MVSSHTNRFLAVAVAALACAAAAPVVAEAATSRGHDETVGGVAHTWSNYRTAGGRPGHLIASHQTVQVSCRVRGYKVTDGNVWWYRLSGAPWNGRYYVSADAFYNDGARSGSLLHTPFFDTKVPLC